MRVNSNKRILFVVDDYHIGGVSSFVKLYAFAASKFSWKSVVVGFKGNLVKPSTYFGNSLILETGSKSGFGLLKRLFDSIRFNLGIIQVIRDCDVVHLSTPWASFYALINPIAWIKKKVITFYGVSSLEYFGQYSELTFKYKLVYLTRIYFQYLGLLLADKIIVFSDYSKNILGLYFSNRLLKKCIQIPGYLITKREFHGTPNNSKFTLVNFGRFEGRKGIDILIEATYELKALTKTNIELILASPFFDYWTDEYYKLYEKSNAFLSIRFVHRLDDSQINTLLSQADLFVMPSRDYETFGLTVIEAMSYGVPVISSSAGALPETVGGFDKRFLVNPLTPKNLAKKILWYMNLSKKEKLKIRKNVYNYVYKKYWWENYSKQLIDVYENN